MNRLFAKIILASALTLVSVLGVSIVSSAPQVFAQNTQPTDKPTNGEKGGFVPCGNTADNPCTVGHLFAAFVVIVNYLISMAGFVAVFFIVFAGLQMVSSQGQEKLAASKKRLTGAITGLVIVALAFVLANALFAGSLSVGVKDGPSILANPLDYISKAELSNTNSK